MKILAINPGSTSTKIAVFEDETPLLVRNIRHTVDELAAFPQVTDQFDFRKSLVLTELEKEGIPFQFDAIIGRGGLVKPIPGGVYEVNEAMRLDTLHAMRTHALSLIHISSFSQSNIPLRHRRESHISIHSLWGLQRYRSIIL